jgi:hypothetical protein
MPYVRKYLKSMLRLPTAPKTLLGFRRRYVADTKMLDRLEETNRLAFLKIIRSWTLMQADEQFGEVRFQQLCRELSISSEQLGWHKRIAENAGKLLRCANWIPCDDQALEMAARVESERLLVLQRSGKSYQDMRIELQELTATETAHG